jgi:Ca2+-binding RTX toxin-like protein
VNAAGGVQVTGDSATVSAAGVGARVDVRGGETAYDRLVVNGGQLDVNGSAAADVMTVVAFNTSRLVEVAGWNVLVEPAAIVAMEVNGLGGDDQMVTAGAVTAPLVLDGGDGNDQMRGGHGDDLILGGPGNDRVDGERGADVVLLGDGDDTFNWDPGDGNDHVEGEAGEDALTFNGASIGEQLVVKANGAQATVSRNIGIVLTTTSGVEQLDLMARAGADSVHIGDLAGTAVRRINVELAAQPGGTTGDVITDAIVVAGSPLPESISITADAGAVVVSGLTAAVRILHPEGFDALDVYGMDGADQIYVDPAAMALMQIWALD